MDHHSKAKNIRRQRRSIRAQELSEERDKHQTELQGINIDEHLEAMLNSEFTLTDQIDEIDNEFIPDPENATSSAKMQYKYNLSMVSEENDMPYK